MIRTTENTMNRSSGTRHVLRSNLSAAALRSYRLRLERQRQAALVAAGRLEGDLRRIAALVQQGESAAARYSGLRTAA